MSFSDASGAPYIHNGQTFKRLTLAQIGVVAELFRESRMKRIRRQVAAEPGTPEVKEAAQRTLLVREAQLDYSIDDVHQWAVSLEGSQAVVKTSAPDFDLGQLSAASLQTVAMELVDHPAAPSRQRPATPPSDEKKSGDGG